MKLKTNKSALKRINIKKRILIRKKAFKSHLLINKSSRRLRLFNVKNYIHKSDIKSFLKLIPKIKFIKNKK